MLSKEQEEDPCQAAELSPIGFSCLSTQKKKNPHKNISDLHWRA